MNKLKILNLFICIPFLSFGQCDQGLSYLEIFTNGDGQSDYQNEVTITLGNGSVYDSFFMASGNENEEYCLEPGIYIIKITDSGQNGIGNYFNTNNRIRIVLDEIEKFNLDYSTEPAIYDDWSSQEYTLTISDTYEEFTGTYSYVNDDASGFHYSFPEGSIAQITIQGYTEVSQSGYVFDYITFFDGTGQQLQTLSGDFNETLISNDNIISFSWSSDFSNNSSDYGPTNWIVGPQCETGCNDFAYVENFNFTEISPGIYEIDLFNYPIYCENHPLSCSTPIVTGCVDENACNYNASANTITSETTCSYPSENYLDCDGNCLIDSDGDGICDQLEILGCTDESSCNFDASATDDGTCEYAEDYLDCDGNCLMDSDDDGICDELEVSGCTDMSACNYDYLATDDGTCEYAEDYLDCDGNCLMDSDDDGICDELEVSGCTDMSACNYDYLATDDGICEYTQDYYDCDGNCLMDSDGDGICDELEVLGCTDISACNFNPFASDDDNSCENISCYGCVDQNACNYNAIVLYPIENCIYASDVSDCASCSGETDGTGVVLDNDIDGDGICNELEVLGCTDILACNYDENPTTDTDNSLCYYSTDLDNCASCSGETDGTGTIIDNDNDNDGICNLNEIIGCTNILACNYDSFATDEGECNFALEYYDCDGNCLNDSDDNSICDEFQVDGCSDPNACNYNVNANVNDGSCEFPLENYDCFGNCINDSNLNGICDELEVSGCTDSEACNFNENANLNDGSCDFPQEYYDCFGNCLNDLDLNGICDELDVSGCTDSEACNYNSNATLDDGTCEYLEITLEYNNSSSSLEAISSALIASYQWNINGENTNISTDRLNPFINGLYTVIVYDEVNDCWGEASYNINDVSINEVNADIKIFPNPVHNTLYIKSKLNNQNTKIEVYNYLGKLLDANQNKIAQHMQIDVSKLSSGIYIIKLKSEDFISQKEFIKY